MISRSRRFPHARSGAEGGHVMRTWSLNTTALIFACELAVPPIRVTPLFWFSSPRFGPRYYAYPEQGSLGYFLFWMVAVFVSVLLHEAGHIFVGRLFGMHSEVVLSALGGTTLGFHALLRRWQRLVVLLAGPAIQFHVVAAIWGITYIPFPQIFWDWGWETWIANGLAILFWINFYWALLNVVPLLPLDGGRMACEIGEAILGRRGAHRRRGVVDCHGRLACSEGYRISQLAVVGSLRSSLLALPGRILRLAPVFVFPMVARLSRIVAQACRITFFMRDSDEIAHFPEYTDFVRSIRRRDSGGIAGTTLLIRG